MPAPFLEIIIVDQGMHLVLQTLIEKQEKQMKTERPFGARTTLIPLLISILSFSKQHLLSPRHLHPH